MKILSFFSLLFLFSCTQAESNTTERKVKGVRNIGINSFVKFDFENPKAVIMNCAKGRVKARIRYYDKAVVEVHKSFLKFVNFETKGDTLFIYTKSWPNNDRNIEKQINIYLPDLEYIETGLTDFIFSGFNSNELKVSSNNTALRYTNCKIKDLDIHMLNRSNLYVNSNCTFDNVKIKREPECVLTFFGNVNEAFTLHSKDLESFKLKNVPEDIITWIQ
jgi:hypothetical protein